MRETMKNIFRKFLPVQIVGFAILIALSWTAFAQQPAPATASQGEINQQLLDRIAELEKEVKQLRQATNQSSIQTPTPPAPAPAPLPEPVAIVEITQANVVADRLKLNFFGDTGYQIGHFYGPANTFEFGEFDMFATARLSEHVSALGEILFTSSTDNSVGVDVERLLLKYRADDYFAASIGRIHTDIGYYNTAFHRGDYFQTTIGRPVMYEFDDQGGFLPLQDLGVVLEGKVPSGKLGLNYVFEVTNGRAYGINAEPAQNSTDGNNSKAVNLNMSAKPEWVPGLAVGFSVRHDYLSDVNNLRVSETIPVFYAVYNSAKYEWLNEAMVVRHARPVGPVYHTTAFYTQFSRRFGAYRPYFRYSYVNAPENDPIYGDPTEIQEVGRVNGPTVGMRYDFNDHAAFKLQYDREGTTDTKSINGGSGQFAFTF